MNRIVLARKFVPNVLQINSRYLKIYTKTGDKGTSSTFTGERRRKDDQVFHALGATDELSSHIGVAREYCSGKYKDLSERLMIVQCVLQDLGSSVATPKSSARDSHIKKTEFNKEMIDSLEKWIDEYMAVVPPLKQFILPSGGLASSHLHVARSVCRRAEREIVPLLMAEEVDAEPVKFINRLSDFLFAAARYCAHKDGTPEEVYRRTARDVVLTQPSKDSPKD